jgi:hypothetical protein
MDDIKVLQTIVSALEHGCSLGVQENKMLLFIAQLRLNM